MAQGLDEIWVCAGVYTENITIPAGLSVYGGFSGTEANRSERDWKSNVTVVQSPSRTFDVITSGFRKVILDGFHVRNGRKGVNVRVGPATLANCSISANVDHGVHVCDGVVTLANCIVNGNGNYGVLGEFSLLTVTNCTISANSDVGVHSSFCITTLNNCTIAACNAGVSLTGQGELWAMNCIIAMNEIGFRVYDPIYIFTALSCNNVFGNTTANYLDHPDPTDDGGNISKDPLFVNRTGQNFRLLPGSPCVDAGADSVVTAGQLDLDGKPRILGAHVDIGAYEFSAALPPYSLSEAIAALKAGAGLLIIPVEDRSRTDVDTDGRITIRDAARIARKVAGREANP